MYVCMYECKKPKRKIFVNNTATGAKGGGVAIYVQNGVPCKVKFIY